MDLPRLTPSSALISRRSPRKIASSDAADSRGEAGDVPRKVVNYRLPSWLGSWIAFNLRPRTHDAAARGTYPANKGNYTNYARAR